ncbi:hypothetical protein ACFO1B_56535 [Dactylosporangium siamense]|uniref:Uncharacterized protein n=1 Tax=Dactylosporangium siamense TaxID=685454 RepID=A0A919PLE4_9ACTN|nr:hypothetical protein [Dactylosporangium siamense]GIG44585.1 hypothetical protein Dsi01nite_026260 [Dactylosporangium siamense]
MSREEQPAWTAVVHFRGGSVPPPWHHEWSITLGATGDARLDYRPDYRDPTWTYTAPVDTGTREAVWAVVQRQEPAPPPHPGAPIGGDSSWAVTTIGESRIIAGGLATRELFGLLRARFGPGVWDEIAERRKRYIAEHPRTHESGASMWDTGPAPF